MLKNIFIILSMCIFFSPTSAWSKEDYECVIMQHFNLFVDVGVGNKIRPTNGPLIQIQTNQINNNDSSDQNSAGVVGSKFSVFTKTGLIVGKGYANDLADKRHILLKGSTQQSFIVVSEYGPVPAFTYFTMKTFDVSDQKSFLAMVDSDVFTGYCR